MESFSILLESLRDDVAKLTIKSNEHNISTSKQIDDLKTQVNDLTEQVSELKIQNSELLAQNLALLNQRSSQGPLTPTDSSPRLLINPSFSSRLSKIIIEPSSITSKNVVKVFRDIERKLTPIDSSKMGVINKLTSGSSSQLFLAKYMGNDVIIKEFYEGCDGKEFICEVSSLMLTKHSPYIADMIGATTESSLKIVLRYYPNGDINQYLMNNTVSDEMKIKWVYQLCIALNTVHGLELIHRDLKSHNIFLDKDLNIVLGDFGLVQSNTAKKSSFIGTMRWSSPCVLLTNEWGFASDIYSLGVVIWELCTNCAQIPYHDKKHDSDVEPLIKSNIIPVFPPDCNVTLLKIALACLKFSPSDRPSASDIISFIKIDTDMLTF